MLVRDAIGKLLVELNARTVFGVIGSGNFHITNAVVEHGGRFFAARHEGGAANMADAYARMSGEVSVLSLHQGCGYSNAVTGIAEAAKSHTPLLVVTAEATDPTSNFYIDQSAIATGVGAVAVRVRSASTALTDVSRAVSICRDQGKTVVLNVPIDVQDMPVVEQSPRRWSQLSSPAPAPTDVARLAEILDRAERPLLIAGRGGRSTGAKEALRELGAQTGALLATSAVARGLFNDDPWSIDVSGGFSSPLTAELVRDADVIVGFGCTMNMWTMRHGKLIGPGATVVQVDLESEAIGRNREVGLGVVGDVMETARATTAFLRSAGRSPREGYRRPEVGARIRDGLRWNQLDFADESGGGRIDPRLLTLELNRILPSERVVSVDSGNFLGYPSMYLDVPDENGFCFTQAFQAVGLGLGTALGAAIAQPDRLPVLGVGDGGFLMGISELETAVRLEIPLLVVVYDDAMYGAEVHHFEGDDVCMDNVCFPDRDLAAIARGFGCDAAIVREQSDLGAVKDWLSSNPKAPMVLDAKVVSETGSWWLQEAFGH